MAIISTPSYPQGRVYFSRQVTEKQQFTQHLTFQAYTIDKSQFINLPLHLNSPTTFGTHGIYRTLICNDVRDRHARSEVQQPGYAFISYCSFTLQNYNSIFHTHTRFLIIQHGITIPINSADTAR